jgi:hypothetical protein
MRGHEGESRWYTETNRAILSGNFQASSGTRGEVFRATLDVGDLRSDRRSFDIHPTKLDVTFRLNSGYLAGNWRKIESKQGSCRSEKCRNLALFFFVVPRLSLLLLVPKLDVAGSTPVARSMIPLAIPSA